MFDESNDARGGYPVHLHSSTQLEFDAIKAAVAGEGFYLEPVEWVPHAYAMELRAVYRGEYQQVRIPVYSCHLARDLKIEHGLLREVVRRTCRELLLRSFDRRIGI